MPIGLRVPDLPPVAGLDGTAATSGPPDVLLLSGGPAPFGSRLTLALDAFALSHLTTGVGRRPRCWETARFGRDVEQVRADLRPIRSQEALAGSFGRESFHAHASGLDGRGIDVSAVRVAYATRWLELADGVERPTWPEWLATRGGGRLSPSNRP